MTECIILAGGKSTRMGTNKMLLSYKGHPLIWYTLKSVEPFVSRIIVVTGKYALYGLERCDHRMIDIIISVLSVPADTVKIGYGI